MDQPPRDQTGIVDIVRCKAAVIMTFGLSKGGIVLCSKQPSIFLEWPFTREQPCFSVDIRFFLGRRWNICSRNGAYPVTHERFKSAAKTLHRLCPVQLFNQRTEWSVYQVRTLSYAFPGRYVINIACNLQKFLYHTVSGYWASIFTLFNYVFKHFRIKCVLFCGSMENVSLWQLLVR